MNLAQEHREDLRRSGLDDEAVKACEFESVRPHDFKGLKGVESAYRLPYFNLDGTRNCAERLKLFPPISDASGHKRKYHQAKDSSPSLYLPPLIDWKAVAADPSQAITITEGEKKSVALCQRDIKAIGLGGVWNWRVKLDSGDRLDIPTLDLFTWEGRRVEVVPDSDCWRKDKRNALLGLFWLAMVLVMRGAEVVFVILQDERGRKVGADDFIVSRQGDFLNQWPMLERIQLDDQRLAEVALWHQKLKAKQATQDAFRDRTADDLILTEAVGLYTVTSAMHALTLEFDNLHVRGTGVITELSVSVGSIALREHIDLNLKSDHAQTQLARNLHALCEYIPWKVLLPRACSLVLKRYRQGAPLLRLDKQTVCEPLSFVVNPLVLKRKPTVLFGHGGTGKSTLALTTGLLVSVGGSLAGMAAVKGRPLYLDWEDSEEVHTRRLHALQAAHPELGEGYVEYRRCVEPLARMTHELGRTLQREGTTYLIIDSLLAAAGGGSDAEATEQFFAALRMLDVATLIIGHVAKGPIDGQNTATIYGSVFNSNFARSTWELQIEQELGDDSAVLGLFHRKTNLTRKHHPIGLKVTQNEMGAHIHYEAHDLGDTAELEKSLPLASRIRNLLDSDGTPRTSKQISDELGVKLGTVKSCLSKGKKHKWSLIGEHGDKEALWTTIAS